MKPPTYSPRLYESPIEDRFARELVPLLDLSCDFAAQVAVETICGRFVIDFVAKRGDKRIAFECDGADFHDAGRDEWRDAMILGAECVDSIYRLRGRDIVHSIDDCLFVVATWDADLFAPRGLNIARSRASQDVIDQLGDEDERWGLRAILQHRDSPELFIAVERRLLAQKPGAHDFWRDLFKFAKSQGGGDLDTVIAALREEHPLPGLDGTLG